MTDYANKLRKYNRAGQVQYEWFEEAATYIEELEERLKAATDDAKEAEAYAEELEATYNDITLDIDEDGIWLIDNTDQGDMQMGHVSWRQIAIHVQKELEELKEDDTDAQVIPALKEAQERTKGMLTEADADREMSKHFVAGDDLMKRLRHSTGYWPWAAQEAANRIEELEAEVKSGAMDYLVAHGQASDAYQAQLAAEAKLAKAVEALGYVIDLFSADDVLLKGTHLSMDLNYARTTLAELKGDSDDE